MTPARQAQRALTGHFAGDEILSKKRFFDLPIVVLGGSLTQ
jgi:hypothetical protein